MRAFERRARQTRRPHQGRQQRGPPAADRDCFPARVSRELLLRQENQPKPIREIGWKAQLRLCARYRKLARSGKPANVVTAAIARELAGFIWAIARRVPPAAG
jgi:hypothetical protein